MTTETTPATTETLKKNKGGRPRKQWHSPGLPGYQPPDERKVEDLEKKVAALMAKLEEVQSQANQPKFVPMKRDTGPSLAGTYEPPEALAARVMKGLTKAGDQVSGRVGLLSNPEYLKKIPPQNRPVFKSGDQVKINPEARIWGSDKTWASILEARRVSGEGEILSIQYMTKTWEPKYTVHVPGLTRKDGDGFRESELLPA